MTTFRPKCQNHRQHLVDGKCPVDGCRSIWKPRKVGRMKQRKRLNPRSEAAKQRAKDWGPERAKYLAGVKACHICGSKGGERGLAVHEILDGTADRPKAFCEPATWLVVCWPCNSGPLKSRAEWPQAKQLALKRIVDRPNYSLYAISKIIGNTTRITQEEVDRHEAEIRALQGEGHCESVGLDAEGDPARRRTGLEGEAGD